MRRALTVATLFLGALLLTPVSAGASGPGPGMAGPNGTVPTLTVSASHSLLVVHPDGANGCNQAVCISLSGSGTDVTDWLTNGNASKAMCTYAEFWENGSVIATSNEQCGPANDLYTANWSNPGNFPVGASLCNTWSGLPGKPCETIE